MSGNTIDAVRKVNRGYDLRGRLLIYIGLMKNARATASVTKVRRTSGILSHASFALTLMIASVYASSSGSVEVLGVHGNHTWSVRHAGIVFCSLGLAISLVPCAKAFACMDSFYYVE